ncbi:uncharacterized protein LOC115050039 isoform X2 [Echeneis naucrates]|uniref:Uncharacterized LOC115050039 n=1 Tax=Echeneis naucrates TaxID=173247 RepID=A0A665WDV5_ECHNA|nr:uncharacterized protein LOC115050039 isoform X2 [Echeneis naucrates]
MRLVLYLLLILRVGRCSDKQMIVMIPVGDKVSLTCEFRDIGKVLWMKIVSGNLPQILKRTNSVRTDDPRITAQKESGKFILHIEEVKQSDTGVYFCLKTKDGDVTFLKRIDLTVEGTEIVKTAAPTSHPTNPKDSVFLQCSTLSESETTEHPEKKCVCCFKAGTEIHPSVIDSQRNSICGFDDNPEGACTKTWNCSFSNVFSSNASTHCCAAVTCGQIFSGGSSKKKCGENVCNSQTDNTVLFLLCAALALSLSVIACLLYSTNKRKQNSQCNYAAVALNATAGANQERQQTDEDSLVYSAPAFIDRQASTSKARTRDAKSEEEEEDTIYTNIKTLEMD